MKEKIIKLKNGGILVYSKSKLNNCSAVEAGFFAGAYNENKIGTAHLCEHTLFKKTKNRDNLQIENDRNEIVFINASTSLDYLTVNFFRSNKLIKESMELAEDVLMNSIIDDEYLETEKGVVVEELNMCLDSESRDVYVHNLRQSQTKAKFASDIVGRTSEEISKIEFKDLLQFKNDYFVGNNFVVSVTTPLSLFKVRRLVNKYFVEKIPYKKESKQPKNYFKDLVIDKESSLSIVNNNQDKITVLLSFKLDLNELDLIKDLNYSFLAKYFSGAQGDLFLKLRNKGLIYRFFSDYSCFSKDSLFNIVFETSKEKIKDILEIVKEDIYNIVNNSVPQKYIDSYKKNFDYFNDERMPVRMSYTCHKNLVEYLYFGKLIKVNNRQRKKYKNNVTIDNIKTAANKFFNKNTKMFVTVLGNITEEYVPKFDYFKENFLISEENLNG